MDEHLFGKILLVVEGSDMDHAVMASAIARAMANKARLIDLGHGLEITVLGVCARGTKHQEEERARLVVYRVEINRLGRATKHHRGFHDLGHANMWDGYPLSYAG